MSRRTPASRVLRRAERVGRPFESRTCTAGTEADPLAAAFERGRQQGYHEGLEHAGQEAESALGAVQSALAAALKNLLEAEQQRIALYDSLVKEIALAAASRIVRQRIDNGDPVASRALHEAIDALPGRLDLRARVHPDDLAAIAADLSAAIEAGALELVEDEAIERGGCLVESPAGTIDATIATATGRMHRAAEGNGDGEAG